MLQLVTVVALTGTAFLWPRTDQLTPSFLFRMQAKGGKVEFQKEAFQPREGDIVLYDSHQPWLTRIYKLVGTAGPLHAGIVFKKADGSFAVLEAGANFALRVSAFDVEKRLHEYPGSIIVRRLRVPLAPDQSKQLTEFCQAQEGKSYAVGRLMLQGTPLKARGWRAPLFGRTYLDRDRWICSELVVAAAAAAGILNGQEYPANGIYPRDLAYDEEYDFSAFYDRPAIWLPRAELEYVGDTPRITDRPTK